MNLTYILITIIIILIFVIFYMYNNHTNLKIENQKLNKENETLHNQLKHTNNDLNCYKEQIKIYEKEILEIPFIKISAEIVKKKNTYKNKRALIGDYMESTAEKTMKVLQYYGFTVDVVRSGLDIIDRIQHGYKYDIIFTNNTYLGSIDGPDVLERLREIKNFNTPVVIHTISEDERYFINRYKFDAFILKPVNIKKIQPILDKLFPKSDKKEK